MKQLARILSLLVLVSATVYFTACDSGGGEEKSEKEIQIDKLAGTWTATEVTYEGDDLSADYADFKITITKASSEAMTFTTSNRPDGKLSPWDQNGTFTFSTPVSSKLLRGDNVFVDYSVSENSLTLTLANYSGSGYTGRVGTVAGDWVFEFSK